MSSQTLALARTLGEVSVVLKKVSSDLVDIFISWVCQNTTNRADDWALAALPKISAQQSLPPWQRLKRGEVESMDLVRWVTEREAAQMVNRSSRTLRL